MSASPRHFLPAESEMGTKKFRFVHLRATSLFRHDRHRNLPSVSYGTLVPHNFYRNFLIIFIFFPLLFLLYFLFYLFMFFFLHTSKVEVTLF